MLIHLNSMWAITLGGDYELQDFWGDITDEFELINFDWKKIRVHLQHFFSPISKVGSMSKQIKTSVLTDDREWLSDN